MCNCATMSEYMSKRKSILFILLVFLLSACQKDIPLEYKEYIPLESPKDTIGSVHALEILHIDGVNIKTNVYSVSSLNDVSRGFDSKFNNLLSNSEDPKGIKEQRIVVAPVYFNESSVSNNEELKSKKKTLIENAFFGDVSKTNYQSVASYYNLSLYGHLRLSGEVLDWIDLETSVNSASSLAKNKPEDYTDQVVKKVVDQLSEEVLKRNSTNNENMIDSLFLVYDYPYSKEHSENSLFWAFSSHHQNPEKVSSYAWASFDFLGEKVLENHLVDSTTYIHETGHLLGLVDYYNSNTSISYQPTGFMDMMDYNLGDHSPLSKFLLNWTSPTVLEMGDENEKSISLKSFTDSGECILIPRGEYNGTAYDKYLLVSFFTPTGLNNMSNYPSYVYYDKEGKQQVFNYPTQYGILVHEIDARLAYFKSEVVRNSVPTCYINETPDAGNYVINFYHDNEITSSNDTPLYHLLESSGQNSFKEGYGASNKTLFKLGATFGEDTFKDLANECGVSFRISKVTLKESAITFSKI